MLLLNFNLPMKTMILLPYIKNNNLLKRNERFYCTEQLWLKNVDTVDTSSVEKEKTYLREETITVVFNLNNGENYLETTFRNKLMEILKGFGIDDQFKFKLNIDFYMFCENKPIKQVNKKIINISGHLEILTNCCNSYNNLMKDLNKLYHTTTLLISCDNMEETKNQLTNNNKKIPDNLKKNLNSIKSHLETEWKLIQSKVTFNETEDITLENKTERLKKITEDFKKADLMLLYSDIIKTFVNSNSKFKKRKIFCNGILHLKKVYHRDIKVSDLKWKSRKNIIYLNTTEAAMQLILNKNTSLNDDTN